MDDSGVFRCSTKKDSKEKAVVIYTCHLLASHILLFLASHLQRYARCPKIFRMPLGPDAREPYPELSWASSPATAGGTSVYPARPRSSPTSSPSIPQEASRRRARPLEAVVIWDITTGKLPLRAPAPPRCGDRRRLWLSQPRSAYWWRRRRGG